MNNVDIHTLLYGQHQNIVGEINKFPQHIYVAKCNNGKWATIAYPKKGLGLACFLSQKDTQSWSSKPDFKQLKLIEMTIKEAIKLAKKENLQYLHLLSNNVTEPLSHHKIS